MSRNGISPTFNTLYLSFTLYTYNLDSWILFNINSLFQVGWNAPATTSHSSSHSNQMRQMDQVIKSKKRKRGKEHAANEKQITILIFLN